MVKYITTPQQTDSHCGPAVVQALLDFYHIQVSQDEIVSAARVKTSIMKKGVRLSQINRAITKLAPNLRLWFKQYTSQDNLEILIHHYHLPVGVNWQGLFYSTTKDEEKFSKDQDRGHFSLIIELDTNIDQIIIDDPYSDFIKNARTFSYKWFESRWWDTDIITDNKTKLQYAVNTSKLCFILTPQDFTPPEILQLQPSSKIAELEQKKLST